MSLDAFIREYRAEVARLLRLPPHSAASQGELIRCVYEPTFHPEWCASLHLGEGVARVSALDHSAWAWFNSRRDGSWADPLKGWLEPGHWDEDIALSTEQRSSVREGFPPQAQPGVPGGIDGMFIGFEVRSSHRSEWRYFHSVSRSEGTALARRIADMIHASATTERIREAASSALRYLG